MRNAAVVLTALLALTNIPLSGQPGYLVGGIVVDSRSHLPLANARVSLAPATTRDRKLERVTSRDGRFAFSVSQPGKYSLQMTKPGYPPQAYKQAPFAGVAERDCRTRRSGYTQLVFEAVRGSAITGQIRDEDSEPVGNALVAVFQSLVAGGERKVVEARQHANQCCRRIPPRQSLARQLLRVRHGPSLVRRFRNRGSRKP